MTSMAKIKRATVSTKAVKVTRYRIDCSECGEFDYEYGNKESVDEAVRLHQEDHDRVANAAAFAAAVEGDDPDEAERIVAASKRAASKRA